jgi:hypothetical protein
VAKGSPAPDEDELSNAATERMLPTRLVAVGYSLSEQRGYGETGVDIVAVKGDETFQIEVIGYKKNPPQRSRDFYEAFFRVVSRLDQDARA